MNNGKITIEELSPSLKNLIENNGVISSHLVPNADGTINLGEPRDPATDKGNRFAKIYAKSLIHCDDKIVV